MTVTARAIQDGDKVAPRAHVRLNRAAYVGRRIRPIWTNELSGGKDDDGDYGSLLQSSAHGFPWVETWRRHHSSRTMATFELHGILPSAFCVTRRVVP